MPVPLLDVNAQNLPLEAECKAVFERVFRSGRFIMGEALTQFETDLAGSLGVAHALGVSSGTDALLLALMALEIGPGDEVIVPSFTFFATAGAVTRVGAKPVFADVCPYCFNLQPDGLEALVTPRTKAILPVHLFGQAAEMDELLEVARARNVHVIEDAAQSLGARYKDRAVGTLGTCGTFSFYPSKNLSGFGDSGLFVTDDPALYARAKALRVHGMEPKYHHARVGGNFRMDPLQAALLSVKLPHLEAYNAARQANAAYYAEQLTRIPAAALTDKAACGAEAWPASNMTQLLLPVAYPENHHIWNQYTLRLRSEEGGPNRRDALRAHLAGRGIGCEVYYPIPLHRQPCFADVVAEGTHLPLSDQLADEVLSLPIYPELTHAQLDEVIVAIADFFESRT